MLRKFVITLAAGSALAAVAACSVKEAGGGNTSQGQAASQPMTPAGADAFVADAEQQLAKFSVDVNKINWVNATYITDDTDSLAAAANAKQTELQVKLATEAAKYRKIEGLSPDTQRKLDLMIIGITLPAPARAGAADQLATLVTRMSSSYGKGKGTLDGKPINGSDIEAAMGSTRDPAKLKEMWVSWHDNVGAPMRKDYANASAIANEGAKGLGYPDAGALWRAGYDMTPDQFAALTDKLWKEVEPLYKSLHTYVRWKLNEKYGDAVQPKTGPIRADLLGNMWAQEWGNIYDIVAPPGAGDIGYDTTALLTAKGYDPIKMVRTGEGFYSSLGFAPLPETFWQRSQIVKPADREVICHASAWDLDNLDDVRIKMCTKVNADDFVTIHHELGHNYYQRAYKGQPFLYKNGANDGFHEAIGDFVALSITPDYLVKIGLLDQARVPSADKDTGLLLRQAMDKVAFLPFGLLVDKWRWGVFSGAIPTGQYQSAWDKLRLQYQGIVPPVPRDESKFDPGAKYHVPAEVPYTRYFLARLLQFQFYEAACKQAGWTGPLHRCSFYNNKAVGQKLNAMLAMGQSKPWPEALQTFTGSREISGKAMVNYFAPLKAWLDQQNQGKPQGMVKRLLAGAVLVAAAPVTAQVVQPNRLEANETLLQVEATGEARVRPDAAFLDVGVVSTGTSAREATDANATQMAAVVAAIRKAGVDPRYVRTQQINVQPKFARQNGNWDETAQITGYVARNSVSVTVVKLAIAPEVIAAAFAAGANSVSGPNLGNEDPNLGLNDARNDALANARAEADAYAAGLGMRIARVLRVSETGGSIQPLQYITVTGSRVGAPPAPPPPPPPPPLAGGELKRTLHIYIDYALVPKG